MNKKLLTISAAIAISLFSVTSIVAKDKEDKGDKGGKKDCKKECGIALNACNTETSKIDKSKKDERKANHNKCQKEFTECKAACKK